VRNDVSKYLPFKTTSTSMKTTKKTSVISYVAIVATLMVLSGCETAHEQSQPQDIFSAASAGDLRKVEGILQVDPSQLNAREGHGLTPLQIASRDGRLPVVKLLVAKGADVNLKWEERGYTALHLASLNGQKSIVAFLSTHGADSMIKDGKGNTATECMYEGTGAGIEEHSAGILGGFTQCYIGRRLPMDKIAILKVPWTAGTVFATDVRIESVDGRYVRFRVLELLPGTHEIGYEMPVPSSDGIPKFKSKSCTTNFVAGHTYKIVGHSSADNVSKSYDVAKRETTTYYQNYRWWATIEDTTLKHPSEK
jgi:hypothetical protein